jgi:hypothetical protein
MQFFDNIALKYTSNVADNKFQAAVRRELLPMGSLVEEGCRQKLCAFIEPNKVSCDMILRIAILFMTNPIRELSELRQRH